MEEFEFLDFYNELVEGILGRKLLPQDGLAIRKIENAEVRLGIPLPPSLREYYRVAGNLVELNEKHNRLLPPEKLLIEGDYLIFLEENQNVVWWGIKIEEACDRDPEVWQGLNEVPIEWYSEKMSVSEFLRAMFLWIFGIKG